MKQKHDPIRCVTFEAPVDPIRRAEIIGWKVLGGLMVAVGVAAFLLGWFPPRS